jgi:hypothetical protein
MPGPVTLTDITNSFTAALAPFGSLVTSVDPVIVFTDTYDGGVLDTTNRWTAAGTVPPTASGNGTLLVNPGTAASASSSLVSQPVFAPSGYQLIVSYLQFEAPTIALGNHRFFGLGTQPGGWTAATPLQDAVGFEIDTAGVLRSSEYGNGVRGQSIPLTALKDGANHLLLMHYRPGAVFFAIDNPYQILAFISVVQPTVLNLPLRFHSINGLAITTGTPTMAASVSALADFSRPAQGVSDGQFPWRKKKVGANGEVYSNNAIAPYPNAPTNIAYASAVDTAFSAANLNRRQYIVSNDTTAKLYILIDQSGAGVSSATNFTYVIPAGGTFEMPNPVSTARVRGFWAAGGAGSAAVTDISGGTVTGSA